jgi:hypothetical protein
MLRRRALLVLAAMLAACMCGYFVLSRTSKRLRVGPASLSSLAARALPTEDVPALHAQPPRVLIVMMCGEATQYRDETNAAIAAWAHTRAADVRSVCAALLACGLLQLAH